MPLEACSLGPSSIKPTRRNSRCASGTGGHARSPNNVIAKSAKGVSAGTILASSSLSTIKRAFRDGQIFDWNILDHDNSALHSATFDIQVGSCYGFQVHKALWRDQITQFLVEFTNCAFQIGFVALSVTAKKRHFSRVQNAGGMIPLLK
jgi:hypothetical protein